MEDYKELAKIYHMDSSNSRDANFEGQRDLQEDQQLQPRYLRPIAGIQRIVWD